MQVSEDRTNGVEQNADRLADFIMFAQRSFLLDLSRELNKGNISYAQFFLLGYLANEDYLTMTDISRKMGHSTAAATGLVDRLEKLGYVQRLHAADDRRKVMVQITRKGLDMVSRLRNGQHHRDHGHGGRRRRRHGPGDLFATARVSGSSMSGRAGIFAIPSHTRNTPVTLTEKP